VISGVVAFIAVKWLLRYVQSHRFTIFAWYRIVLGIDPAGAGDAGGRCADGASSSALRRCTQAVLHGADGGEAPPAHLLTDRSTA